MSHDYVNQQDRPAPKIRPKLGLWFVTLLAVIAFVLFLSYLWKLKPESDDQQSQTSSVKQGAESIATIVERIGDTPVIETLLEDTDKRFSFYKFFPTFNMEQNIKDIKPQKNQEDRQSYEPKKSNVISYSIQTDSLRDGKDADRRKAQLLLLGFDVQVSQVKLDSSGIWYRVAVGPYKTKRELHRAQNLLAQANIVGAVREVKGG